jgi:hypothetical protein
MRSPLNSNCERFLELFANLSTLTHAVSQRGDVEEPGEMRSPVQGIDNTE